VVHILPLVVDAKAGGGTASVCIFSEIARYRVGDTSVICHELEPHQEMAGEHGGEKGGSGGEQGGSRSGGTSRGEWGGGGGAVLLHSNRNGVLSVRHGRLSLLRVAFQERFLYACRCMYMHVPMHRATGYRRCVSTLKMSHLCRSACICMYMYVYVSYSYMELQEMCEHA